MSTQSIDPKTGLKLADPIVDSSKSEVGEAVSLSAVAFGDWSKVSSSERASVLEQIATALDANVDELAQLADQETALGIPRLVGEVARTTFQLRLFANELKMGELLKEDSDEKIDGAPPQGRPQLKRAWVALGPVAVFGASNFPFAFGELGGDTASALAAGCTVVVKEHPAHPQLAKKVIELSQRAIEQAGYSKNILLSVRGFTAGQELVTHPLITACGFTGSQGAGRALFELAVTREIPIPFYGELGSINPVFVTEAAAKNRISEIASGFVGSFTLGAGQFCTKPSLIFVPESSEFSAEALKVIDPETFATLLTPSIQEKFFKDVEQVKSKAGVKTVIAPKAKPEGFGVSIGLMSVSIEDFLANLTEISHECFGPVAVVVTYKNHAQLLEVASKLDGALVTTFQSDLDSDKEILKNLVQITKFRTGRLVLNGWPTGVAVTRAQHHGGPYPASTNLLHTSVGSYAMMRFVRPVTFQDFPPELVN
jgi:NADP-dependent aldehyde dehydrogenase